jgi:dihydroorotase
MRYDLLLAGGTLIDPSQGICGPRDVAFAAGRVCAIAEGLAMQDAETVVDCAGKTVSPGWIDLHVHVYEGVSHYGTEADAHCIACGVTTAVDAGSAGADTFEGFLRYVVERKKTRLFAFLNISSMGMLSNRIGELEHLPYSDALRAVETVEQHRDLILGIKVRLTKNLVAPSAGIAPLRTAREAADAAGVPLVVHPNDAWCGGIEPILELMKPGDILTHCFHGRDTGILDDRGMLKQQVREAAERGVIFDVGHGVGSFRWEVAEHALAQGFLPRTISTDIHRYNVQGPVFDLATTMSKFLLLGMPLPEVVARVTANPATLLPKEEGPEGRGAGTLRVGSRGEAVVFSMKSGSFDFYDAHGARRTGRLRVLPTHVVHDGRLYNGSRAL